MFSKRFQILYKFVCWRDIELEKCHNLNSNELCSVNKNGSMELTEKGQELQIKNGASN